MAQGWRIVPGSTRGTDDLISGRFVPVMEYTVETIDGATVTFRTPVAQYNEQNVRATIEEWYARHSEVLNL